MSGKAHSFPSTMRCVARDIRIGCSANGSTGVPRQRIPKADQLRRRCNAATHTFAGRWLPSSMLFVPSLEMVLLRLLFANDVVERDRQSVVNHTTRSIERSQFIDAGRSLPNEEMQGTKTAFGSNSRAYNRNQVRPFVLSPTYLNYEYLVVGKSESGQRAAAITRFSLARAVWEIVRSTNGNAMRANHSPGWRDRSLKETSSFIMPHLNRRQVTNRDRQPEQSTGVHLNDHGRIDTLISIANSQILREGQHLNISKSAGERRPASYSSGPESQGVLQQVVHRLAKADCATLYASG